jgi:tripartite-type tricarboxylate transporter receptor subunit TctC
MKTIQTLCICAALCSAACAADYPTKPIRMLVGFAPGGGTDATARAIAPKLSELLGHQIIIDNRPGATGNIATDIVAKSNPDGYTILMGTIAALAINPSLYQKLPFDPIKDLAPVTRAVDSTNVLVVHPSVAAKSVKELIALAKSKSLNCGSSGVGGAGHLALELFNLQAGVKMTHVPYKGGGPSAQALIGGETALSFVDVITALPQAQAGRLRPIATSTAKRTSLMPELPAIAEAGLPGFESVTSFGLFAPAGTAPEIIARVNREVIRALAAPDVKEKLRAQGIDPAGTPPEELVAHQKQETAKWGKVIREQGIRFE